MDLTFSDILGHWIAIFITIATLSYLYDDNPFYKLAEHLFVGTSIGYVLVIQYFETLKPNLIDRLINPALGFSRIIYVIPLLLVTFLFLRLSKRLSWLGRIAIAFVIALYAGQQVPNLANADLIKQLGSTLDRTMTYAASVAGAESGVGAALAATWPDALGVFVLVFGMAAGLVYFFFSIEHKGAIGMTARLGVWVLMLGFGASFGYTVQGRISLAIGRAMYCLGITQSEAEAARLHSALVSTLCVVVIFGTVIFLERRKRAEEE